MPQVCEFLNNKHSFRTIWQTTTPRQGEADATPEDAESRRHLHVPRMCKLDSQSVINRGAILHELEPDDEKQKELYHDDAHFAPAPYHAFNGHLVEMIASQDLGHGKVNQDYAPLELEVQQAPEAQQWTAEVQQQDEKVQEQAEVAEQADRYGNRSRLRAALGRL